MRDSACARGNVRRESVRRERKVVASPVQTSRSPHASLPRSSHVPSSLPLLSPPLLLLHSCRLLATHDPHRAAAHATTTTAPQRATHLCRRLHLLGRLAGDRGGGVVEGVFVERGGGGDDGRLEIGAAAESIPDLPHRRGDGDVLEGAPGEGTMPDRRNRQREGCVGG